MKDQKLLALLIILLSVPIGGVGLDMYSPALPEVALSLHLSISLVQWTISIFVLGLCFGMLVFGSLSDSLGRKPIMIGGALVFLVTSLVINASQFRLRIIVNALCSRVSGRGYAICC